MRVGVACPIGSWRQAKMPAPALAGRRRSQPRLCSQLAALPPCQVPAQGQPSLFPRPTTVKAASSAKPALQQASTVCCLLSFDQSVRRKSELLAASHNFKMSVSVCPLIRVVSSSVHLRRGLCYFLWLLQLTRQSILLSRFVLFSHSKIEEKPTPTVY